MKTLIIGVGNEYRTDDRVGLVAARRLAAQGVDADVIEASGEGAQLMDLWSDAERVVLIDATRSGAPAGTIHRFDASSEPIPSSFFNYSTHAFSVAEAVELARTLGMLPNRVVVYGIEGEVFAPGDSMTPEVEAALNKLLELVVDYVNFDNVIVR